ncbi:hypothetical protein Q31b_43850 [Novipirellula aureliae]|uniref:Uncharacterized protein n=1 Tax=Novipirellula aureliae TaxID=2527966 RepID=A0A5C6DNZ5_9BACT|nr:hypothetical protein Q31b_43850 [Novipirellula aureliae]
MRTKVDEHSLLDINRASASKNVDDEISKNGSISIENLDQHLRLRGNAIAQRAQTRVWIILNTYQQEVTPID